MFHRAHVIEDYLSTHDDLTYEEVRDLALNIATTDSFSAAAATPGPLSPMRSPLRWRPTRPPTGRLRWTCSTHGTATSSPADPPSGAWAPQRADAWVLQDAWIREVVRLTFEDEFMMAGMDYADQSTLINFNVLLRELDGRTAHCPRSTLVPGRVGLRQTADARGHHRSRPSTTCLPTWVSGPTAPSAGWIVYSHQVFGEMWQTPLSSRSTYAHCVEFDGNGPARIESMFPLGESGSSAAGCLRTSRYQPELLQHDPGLRPVHAAAVPAVRLIELPHNHKAPLFGAGLFC